jgi:hypothetical protein
MCSKEGVNMKQGHQLIRVHLVPEVRQFFATMISKRATTDNA